MKRTIEILDKIMEEQQLEHVYELLMQKVLIQSLWSKDMYVVREDTKVILQDNKPCAVLEIDGKEAEIGISFEIINNDHFQDYLDHPEYITGIFIRHGNDSYVKIAYNPSDEERKALVQYNIIADYLDYNQIENYNDLIERISYPFKM